MWLQQPEKMDSLFTFKCPRENTVDLLFKIRSVTALRKNAKHQSNSSCWAAKDPGLTPAALVFLFAVTNKVPTGASSYFPVLEATCTYSSLVGMERPSKTQAASRTLI